MARAAGAGGGGWNSERGTLPYPLPLPTHLVSPRPNPVNLASKHLDPRLIMADKKAAVRPPSLRRPPRPFRGLLRAHIERAQSRPPRPLAGAARSTFSATPRRQTNTTALPRNHAHLGQTLSLTLTAAHALFRLRLLLVTGGQGPPATRRLVQAAQQGPGRGERCHPRLCQHRRAGRGPARDPERVPQHVWRHCLHLARRQGRKSGSLCFPATGPLSRAFAPPRRFVTVATLRSS